EIDARIDHRSHAARGLDELPTIHEGYHARKLEAMGIVSDRCEINRQIKADNALLRELKAKVKKLAAAVKTSIPELANALESLRENMIVLMYRISHIRISKQKISDYVDAKTGRGTICEIKQEIKEKHRAKAAPCRTGFSTLYSCDKASEIVGAGCYAD
ncbi:MAG: MobA/MobL family protein, partial [Ruminococcus callidus]